MSDKVPIKATFDAAGEADGLAEFVSSDTLGYAHGGTGLAALGSALQYLRTNAAANAMEWGTVAGDIEAVTAGDGLSGGGTSGSPTIDLDLNELTAAAVNVAADSIAIIDADDSNDNKKEAIADLITAIAGVGLAASSGVLNISGLTTSEIAAGSLVLDSETITSNDNNTTIPTSAAVKNYADSETATLTNKTLGAVTLSGAVTGGDQTLSATVFKDYNETSQVITSATDLAIDLALGNTGTLTIATAVDDLHFTNVPTTGVSTFTLIVTQDGTGSRTMDIDAVSVNGGSDATAKTAGGAGLTLSTAANAIDILTFVFVGNTTPYLFSQLAFA